VRTYAEFFDFHDLADDQQAAQDEIIALIRELNR
jgi:hypothetical protein